jgi:hypothetical protein
MNKQITAISHRKVEGGIDNYGVNKKCTFTIGICIVR